MNSVLAKLLVLISADVKGLVKGLGDASRGLNKFQNTIKNVAGAVGIAFGARELVRFGVEVTRLAGQAEAVGIAFDRLPNSIRLMGELKKATGGTVSELELMKRAVQASNFDISLKALPQLLEFATLRAQQTGQSVDYLVDSIVTGIGRKSKLILDNLGISAVQLDKALGGVSIAAADVGQVAEAVGKIAEENLKNMAAFSENADTKIQRLKASWDNLKVSIGQAANESGLIGNSIDALSASMDVLASKHLSFLEKLSLFARPGSSVGLLLVDRIRQQEELNRQQARNETVIRNVDKAFEKFRGNIDEFAKSISPNHPLKGAFLEEFRKRMEAATKQVEPQIITLESLKLKLKELEDQFGKVDVSDQNRLKNIAAQIQATNQQIDAIEKLLKKEEQLVLSRAGKDAVAGTGLMQTKIMQHGQVYRSPTGRDGERSAFATQIQVDLKAVGDYAQGMVEARNASFKATTEMKQHWIDFSGVLSGSLMTIGDSLGGAIAGVEDFGQGVIKAFAGFMGQFGQMLVASGFAALSLQRLITNPATAIVAGTALIALAGVAQASISRAHSSFIGGGGGGSAPGRLPGEAEQSSSRSRIVGYDLVLVHDKNAYRRARLG